MTIRTRADFKTAEVDGKITDGSASTTPTDHREVEKSGADSMVFLGEAEVRVINMTTTPPGAPADRDAYVVAATAIDAWAGREDEIAVWDDGAAAWFFIVPADGQAVWNLADDKEYRWDGAAWAERTVTNTTPSPAVKTQTGTSHDLIASDDGKVVEMNNGSANTLTIQDQATGSYPATMMTSITQLGAGATTITAAAGVTLNGVSAGSATIAARYDGVTLYKRTSDVWVLQGAHGGVA